MCASPFHQTSATPLGAKGNQSYSYRPLPDTCPICHAKVTPVSCGTAAPSGGPELYIAFQCPSFSCGAMFVGKYKRKSGFYELNEVYPNTPQGEAFPECIERISPEFVRIYNQAIAAESFGLDDVAGIGLRKALEFLIKDMAKVDHPDKKDEIEKARLGACISMYISDAKVKSCAERAAWLGNDETHYVRKWAEKDTGDLKALLRLTVSWIDSFEHTKRFEKDMPGKGFST